MKLALIKLCPVSLSLPSLSPRHYLPRTMARATLAVFATVLVGACGPATPAPATAPAAPRPALPPIPLVEGPLDVRMVYPRANQLIQAKDSNFILGSVGNGRATLTVNGQPVRVWPNGAYLGWVANPTIEAPRYDFVVTLGAESIRATLPILLPGMVDSTKPLPPPPPPNVVTDTTPAWVILGDSASAATDTDRVIIGRPGPNSVYRWFLLPGTRVQLTGRYPAFARVRLDSELEIWVDAVDAKTFALDTIAPRRVAGNSRVRSSKEWVDLVIPIAERPPFFVEEGERTLDLTLYDTRSSTDLVTYPTSDSLLRLVEWNQQASDRVRYRLRLNQEPFGYLVFYETGSLVLRVRRKPGPVITPALQRAMRAGDEAGRPVIPPSPLAGLTIAVDPGHPPAGATGPTGYYEADAVLPVAFALQRLLQRRGASVVMTRTTPEAVDLALRPVIARRANAHAFVSLHYNAYGDGINPFQMPNGMEVYFYRPHSELLARTVQTGLVRYQPLVDQGIHYRSLAVVRTTWMPAVLAEGGFIIIPEQENAMRTAEFQERYARAVADGLEEYFRALRSP
jgi:N-acetylmuramoyl-L-alanine amidase